MRLEKPKLSCLAPIQNSLNELNEKVKALEQGQALTKSVHDELLSLTSIINENNNSQEANRATDTESIICLVNRLLKALNHFGIMPSSPSLDLPKAVVDLGQANRNVRNNGFPTDATRPSPLVESRYDAAGPTAHDYDTNFLPSAPQLPYPVRDTFRLDPANNITPRGLPFQWSPHVPPPTLGHSTTWNSTPVKRSGHESHNDQSKRRR